MELEITLPDDIIIYHIMPLLIKGALHKLVVNNGKITIVNKKRENYQRLAMTCKRYYKHKYDPEIMNVLYEEVEPLRTEPNYNYRSYWDTFDG